MNRASLGRPALGVFAILLASYAFFWQSRDWNSASRLMLVYALGDRGTITINGLERQTGDAAHYRGKFYSDKQPGYSLFALPVYHVFKTILRLPPHPIGQAGFAHWPADYWITLGTSGVMTALCGALLTIVALQLGCTPGRGILVGLAYGLATPAYVYATLAYGHETAATCLLAAFLLLRWPAARHDAWRATAAGFLAAYASTIELSVGPVSAILGLFALSQVTTARKRPSFLVAFAAGALIPTITLLAYNTVAFGTPFDLGYAHHVIPRFRQVHSQSNPLGIGPPRWDLAAPLLFSEYRGLLVYAPIVALAPVGWVALFHRKQFDLLLVSLIACVAVFLVNLSYPEWTGGWCTGPRLLLPLLPFAMLAVAAALAIPDRQIRRAVLGAAVILTLAGAVIMTICLGVGGRIPSAVNDVPLTHPLSDGVLRLWIGQMSPDWWIGGRFVRNLVSIAWPAFNDPTVVPPQRQWLQFLPLWIGQIAAITWLLWRFRPVTPPSV